LGLARAGMRVAVLDDGEPGQATGASGAMLGVLGEVVAGEADDDVALRVEAASRHAHWRAELDVSSSRGTFVVASGRRDNEVEHMKAIQAAALDHSLPCEDVATAEVPGLDPAPGWGPSHALFLAEEAWVDAGCLMSRAIEHAREACAIDFVDCRVTRIEHRGSRVAAVVTADGRRISCEHLVLCAGARFHELLAQSGIDHAILPEAVSSKGVGLVLRPGATQAHTALTYAIRTPNRAFACGLHLLPREDGVYLGATNRASRVRGVLGAVTAGEVVLLLRDAIRELATDLGRWDVQRTLFGHRPLTADGRPIVGATCVQGLHVFTGTYRNGVLLGPLLADVLVRSVAGTAEPHPSFSPIRAPSGPSPAAVMSGGLSELLSQLHDDPVEHWSAVLAPILDRLAEELIAQSPHAADLLARYPRREMVPEALVELLQELTRHT
jgi:glycine oxidase